MTNPLAPHRWPWPLPALAAWLLAWGSFAVLGRAGVPPAAAFATALLAGGLCALAARGRWRRLLAAAGFPLSALALGALGGVPPWAWAAAALPLLLAYPLRAWRDAPFFPTPAQALQGLERALPLPPGARVLDAGCGLGHGLAALRRAWPQAELHGTEWSRPLAWAAAHWRRDAQVRRGDMWAQPWAGFDLVYLFQRPESMARAWDKACREAPGAWLASLEFAVPGVEPFARVGTRPVWVYRIPPSTGGASRR